MTKLATFIQSKSQVQPLLEAGVQVFILEDTRLSIRSLIQEIQDDFSNLFEIAKCIHENSEKAKIGIQIDMVLQQEYESIIERLFDEITNEPIHFVQVQDPGFIAWIKEKAPNLEIRLCPDTNNSNIESILAYSKFANAQLLNLELPASDIESIQKHLPPNYPLGIQVHGSILLQYSARRFLQGLPELAVEKKEDRLPAPSILVAAEDVDYPGRKYTFLDNQHGHFMFAHFDRCLLKSWPKLIKLNLDFWLIDGRHYEENHLIDVLTTYSKGLKDPAHFNFESEYNKLSESAPLSLKPGFFNANLTDRERKDLSHRRKDAIGKVINLEKEIAITIELFKPIEEGQHVLLETPEFKQIKLVLHHLKDCWGTSIQKANRGDLVQIPWRKGMVVKSTILPG